MPISKPSDQRWNLPKQVGERIKRWRKAEKWRSQELLAKEWSQTLLAEKSSKYGVKITRAMVNNLEGGLVDDISVKTLFALAAGLGVSPLALLVGCSDDGEDQARSVSLFPKIDEPWTFAADWIAGRHLAPSMTDDLSEEERRRAEVRFHRHDEFHERARSHPAYRDLALAQALDDLAMILRDGLFRETPGANPRGAARYLRSTADEINRLAGEVADAWEAMQDEVGGWRDTRWPDAREERDGDGPWRW